MNNQQLGGKGFSCISMTLRNNKSKAVLLSSATQIEIIELRRLGVSYSEIDRILEVPKGSSQYTINYVRSVSK